MQESLSAGLWTSQVPSGRAGRSGWCEGSLASLLRLLPPTPEWRKKMDGSVSIINPCRLDKLLKVLFSFQISSLWLSGLGFVNKPVEWCQHLCWMENLLHMALLWRGDIKRITGVTGRSEASLLKYYVLMVQMEKFFGYFKSGFWTFKIASALTNFIVFVRIWQYIN